MNRLQIESKGLIRPRVTCQGKVQYLSFLLSSARAPLQPDLAHLGQAHLVGTRASLDLSVSETREGCWHMDQEAMGCSRCGLRLLALIDGPLLFKRYQKRFGREDNRA